MFPDCYSEQAAHAKQMQAAAAKSLALGKAIGAMKGRGLEGGDLTQTVSALRGLYRTPWEMALQKWIESVAPGERTYLRPSRRETIGSDIVLPGRKRESWMLNVILDTSGSMADEIPKALGAIADFCETVAVDDIRLIQCDAAVTADDVLSPQELANFQVGGFGGSDLSPAMRALAEDARVTATVIVTDGDIAYPPEEMPYAVLWVIAANAYMDFSPSYGRVIKMQGGRA
jgi:predicted metal-dependent peptidase